MHDRRPAFDPRLLGSERGFFEIWFAAIVHQRAQKALWVRYTAFRPRASASAYPPMALLWGAYFDQGRPGDFRRRIRSWPLTELRFEAPALSLPAATLEPDKLRGELPELSWDLGLQHRFAPTGHAPGWLEAIPLVKTRASIVSPFADVTGTVRVDETEHDFDGANAILMHIWGTERARKLIWCYVPAFDEPHVHWGLDFVSVKADRLAPWLTTAVLRRGDELIADHRPLTMLRGRSEIAYPRFTASCGLNGQRLHIEARADRDQGASYLYPDPGGTARFVVQSDVGSVACRLQRPGEPELLLRSSTAAVEFHGVEPWDAQQPLAPPPL